MKDEKGYAVLRLSMCGNNCRVVMDFQKGVLWYEKFAPGPKIVKEEAFGWVRQLVEMAFCVCMSREESGRFLFNPYGVLLGTDRNLYLLDMEDENNESCKKKGQRKKIKEKFECTGEREVRTMFAAGRMIQCMMAQSDIYPSIHWREKQYIKKIVVLCGRKEDLEKKKKSIERNVHCLRRKSKPVPAVLWGILCLSLCIGGGGWYAIKHVKGEGQKKHSIIEKSIVGKMMDDSYMEQGKKYFLEFGDYEESKQCFGRVEDEHEKAKHYIILAEYMSGQEKEEKAKEALKSLEAEDKGDLLCMLRVYEKIGDMEDCEEMIDLAKKCCIHEYEKDIYFNEKREFEVKSILCRMYEMTGQKKEADLCYEEMSRLKLDEEQRQQYYTQWAKALMQRNDWKKADEVCQKGIEKVPGSDELKRLRVQAMCMLPDNSREKLLGVLSAYIAQNPNLIKDEEIKKIAAQYQLKMEGGKIWAGE